MQVNEHVGVRVKKSVGSQGSASDKVIENPVLTFFKMLLKKEETNGKKFSRNLKRG